jgi:hypothetical protein
VRAKKVGVVVVLPPQTFPITTLRDNFFILRLLVVYLASFESAHLAYYFASFCISIGLLRQKLLLLQIPLLIYASIILRSYSERQEALRQFIRARLSAQGYPPLHYTATNNVLLSLLL